MLRLLIDVLNDIDDVSANRVVDVVDADVVEDVDVLEEVLGDVGVVELEVLDLKTYLSMLTSSS
eukprot:2885692-Amphidinium_carterae.1